ncbi:tryptophan 2,3-dioxygenase [Marinactinospora thermotolerans]|uniref:Tryptophan 2,3-dioxygenase n=1 Tax=Marinactinospora thermotolerans DSM 45154 TaxID=1122192 RepID=A0A1T4M2A5_9ACTN|nr:tryptophan 2,3-dioxygenase family protein [Marinactinospora thermotolerans]SJZ60908.1 Tryptophan 2,3-dioxygenase holoenzyme [Marinactinospora thermotolerans DSM 45154]
MATTSAQPRERTPVAEEERIERAARGEGPPTLSFEGSTPYARYAGIEALLDLQHPRTGEPAETRFIIATQVMELLFLLIGEEWERARDELEADRVAAAMAALRRGHHAQDVLVSSWDLLATLTPVEFGRFRDVLGEASGVQSPGYRHLEFLIGNKSAVMARPHRAAPRARAVLERALREPGLYDAALRLLHRRGLPVPLDRVERDWTRPYEPDPEVERAWSVVYADETPGAELPALAEALLDTAERVTRWRHRHLMAVKRALGARPGTGGSSGLDWLSRNAARDVFPELWSLRTGFQLP